jgi:tetratricopeptide (TPR) repeat protein
MLGNYEFKGYREGELCLFDIFNISLASPEIIKENSSGEVLNPYTLKKTEQVFSATKNGLFCENIFGSINDYLCDCGIMGFSLKKHEMDKIPKMNAEPTRYEAHSGNKCKICRKPITPIGIRLKKWGHIQLVSPVAHIWFLNNPPSYISSILDIPMEDLKKIIYYWSYVITASQVSELIPKKLITEDQYQKAIKNFGKDKFEVKIGAEAIKDLLQKIDIKILYNQIKDEIKSSSSASKKRKLNTRLNVIENFLASRSSPAHMIIETIPVLPPDLRFITYDSQNDIFCFNRINKSYQAVINRNNRLRKLIELNAPEIIINNEKRLLQGVVDNLFYNKMCNYDYGIYDEEELKGTLSMSELLTFVIDDIVSKNSRLGLRPFDKSKIQRVKTLINEVLSSAHSIRYSGERSQYYKTKKNNVEENLYFIALLNKLRGLCLNVEYADKKNHITEETLQIVASDETNEYDYKYEKIAKLLEKNSNDVSAYIERGEIYLNRELHDSAIIDFSMAIQLDSLNAIAYYKRGIAHLCQKPNWGFYKEANQYELALSDFSKAIEINPNFTDAYYNRGLLFEERNQYESAISDFTKLIDMNPNCIEFYEKRGKVYHHLEEYEKELLDFQSIIRIKPNHTEAYLACGKLYKEIGENDKAICFLSDCIKHSPNNISAYLECGQLYMEIGQYDKAIEICSDCIQFNPDNPDIYNFRANVYEKKNELIFAIQDITKAIEIDSKHVVEFDGEYYLERARIYLKMEQYGKSLADINKVVESYSKEKIDITAILGDRGLVYFKMGEFEKAIEDFDRVLGKNIKLEYFKSDLELSDYLDVYIHRAKAYDKIGQIEQSVQMYKNFVDFSSSSTEEANIKENYSSEISYARKRINEFKNKTL